MPRHARHPTLTKIKLTFASLTGLACDNIITKA